MKRILGLGFLTVILMVGTGAPPAVAVQGDLTGVWTSIDGDGSNQTLTITGSGNHAYAVSVVDDFATVCDGAPALLRGAGHVVSDELFVKAALACLPGGNVLRGAISLGFSYDAATDTLTDSFGVVWSRA